MGIERYDGGRYLERLYNRTIIFLIFLSLFKRKYKEK